MRMGVRKAPEIRRRETRLLFSERSTCWYLATTTAAATATTSSATSATPASAASTPPTVAGHLLLANCCGKFPIVNIKCREINIGDLLFLEAQGKVRRTCRRWSFFYGPGRCRYSSSGH